MAVVIREGPFALIVGHLQGENSISQGKDLLGKVVASASTGIHLTSFSLSGLGFSGMIHRWAVYLDLIVEVLLSPTKSLLHTMVCS